MLLLLPPLLSLEMFKLLVRKQVTCLRELIPPHYPHFSLIMCSPLSPHLIRKLRVTHYTKDASLTYKQPRFLEITCRLAVGQAFEMPAVFTGQSRQIQQCIQSFSIQEKGTMPGDVSSVFRQKQLFIQGERTREFNTEYFNKTHPSPRDRG